MVDVLRLTFDKKNYLLESKAKREKLDADRAAKRVATVVGSGKRGRPKGSKNKKSLTLINEFNNYIII